MKDKKAYIYKITQLNTMKSYVGRAIDPQKRLESHLQTLRAGKHKVEDMQDDYNRFGEDSFCFTILDEISGTDRRSEYFWQRFYNSKIRGCGYNYKDNKNLMVLASNRNISAKEKELNTRLNRIKHEIHECGDYPLTIDGETRTVYEWRRILKSKVPLSTIYRRMALGWSNKDCLISPLGRFQTPFGTLERYSEISVYRKLKEKADAKYHKAIYEAYYEATKNSNGKQRGGKE